MPEAVAVAGPKPGVRADTPVAGVKGAAVGAGREKGDGQDDEDDDDDGGFLSFGTAGDMEVDS